MTKMLRFLRFLANGWIKLQIRLMNISLPINPVASLLNENLFSDVRSIPQGEMDLFEKDIRILCSSYEYSQGYTANWVSHRFRLYITIKWIQQVIKNIPNSNRYALELGEETLATDLLRKYIPQVKWKNTEGDLRYPWGETSQSAELIVCTELLEHVSDLPEGISDSFRKTGMIALLKECFRVLKPGGFLLVTTPNAGSIIH
jgi:SAM-dependent methyltransferase